LSSCRKARRLVSAALLCVFAAAPALARARTCPTLALSADARVRERWPELVDRIPGSFADRADVDACARVELELEGDAVVVSVTLPDGRAASRTVASEHDVIPTLEALLLVPESAQPTAAENPRPAAVSAAPRLPRATPKHRAAGSVTGALDGGPASAEENAGREFGIELSVVTGARAGDGQYGFGAGALSFLEVHGWLLGFLGRVDAYRSFAGSDPESALELAVLGGRRLYLGGVALDLVAGPAIAMKGVTFARTEQVGADELQPMPPPEPTSEPSSGAVPRFQLGVRLGFGGRSILRTFVGVDGEVGPRHADSPSSLLVYSSRMPAYTLGLNFGATVGTP
jgi:hypothetical protein